MDGSGLNTLTPLLLHFAEQSSGSPYTEDVSTHRWLLHTCWERDEVTGHVTVVAGSRFNSALPICTRKSEVRAGNDATPELQQVGKPRQTPLGKPLLRLGFDRACYVWPVSCIASVCSLSLILSPICLSRLTHLRVIRTIKEGDTWEAQHTHTQRLSALWHTHTTSLFFCWEVFLPFGLVFIMIW